MEGDALIGVRVARLIYGNIISVASASRTVDLALTILTVDRLGRV